MYPVLSICNQCYPGCGEQMTYYCNECKKTITMEEFHYSTNRYKKPLCSIHQRSNNMSKTTKDLQTLVRNRHKDESTKTTPQLKTIKDWIGADMETWDKAINKKSDGSFIIKVSDEQTKNRYQKRIKNKDK